MGKLIWLLIHPETGGIIDTSFVDKTDVWEYVSDLESGVVWTVYCLIPLDNGEDE